MAHAVYCGSCPDHPDSVCILSSSTHHTVLLSEIGTRTQPERDDWLHVTAGESGMLSADGTLVLRG